MRLLRIALAETIAISLNVFLMIVYSLWAFKLAVLDTDINPLFALTMVLLSIFGLWVIVRKSSHYLVRVIEGNAEPEAVE